MLLPAPGPRRGGRRGDREVVGSRRDPRALVGLLPGGQEPALACPCGQEIQKMAYFPLPQMLAEVSLRVKHWAPRGVPERASGGNRERAGFESPRGT